MFASVGALDEIVALVHERRRRTHAGRLALVPAIEELAATVERHAVTQVKTLAEQVRHVESERRIPHVDPSALAWNPMRAFGFENAEIRWTKWLASLLDGTCGEPACRVTWSALCSAIARSAPDARRSYWVDAASLPPAREAVWSELSAQGLGRADLVVDHADTIIVIENKLDATWHDGAERTQAEAYRLMAERVRSERGRSSQELILLRNNDNVSGDGWITLDYRHLAAALRDCLKGVIASEATPAEVVAHMPVLVTIHAIEQDLLGLKPYVDVPALSAVARWHRLRAHIEARGREINT